LLNSLIHKVKGGAQLIGAHRLIESCDLLENIGSLPEKIDVFRCLLETENRNILLFQAKYSET
jgi:two-component system sensor histidine kinase EvgS